MPQSAATFLEQVEAFLKRSGMTQTQFGWRVANDPAFVYDLRRGRVPNINLVGKAEQLMAEHDAALSS